MHKGIDELLRPLEATASILISRFSDSHLVCDTAIDLSAATPHRPDVEFEAASWSVESQTAPVTERPECLTVTLSAGPRDTAHEGISLGLAFSFRSWSTSNYVLFPAAVYNGNRFRAVEHSRFIEHASVQLPEPLISDVPRLAVESGLSRIQSLSGDMSTPAVGFYSPVLERGFFLLTDQGTPRGDYSFSLEENDDRSGAAIILRSPGIREDECWKGRSGFPSPDRGTRVGPGELCRIECRLYSFPCSSVEDLFARFFEIRKDTATGRIHHEIPFSGAWLIQQTKYNFDSWVEKEGYYSVGMRENLYQNWQTGWTGGMNAVYPLLAQGDETTRSRALRTFDFLFSTGVSPSGLFFDLYHYGAWHPRPGHEGLGCFLRRNSDALFFIIKELLLIGDQMPEVSIPDRWLEKTRGCADAYVRLWECYGQFGQWVDPYTGTITVGTTASNGIAPAALALCHRYFGDLRYLNTAIESAHHYYREYVRRGLTNGGPGDILQAPDSESAFGLLESFVTLYEVTGESQWLDMARHSAHQCASWCVTYDFRFPDHSTFHRLGMSTTGTVVANVQNKHSAPGICTLSGDALFRLFRYTADRRYLDLIRDIAHAIPQYLSRQDRPIPDVRPGQHIPVMPPGWMNERVNMSDWEERGDPGGDIRRGEIFAGSCWSEVSCMLTYAELPGIYVQPDTGLVCALDHVDVLPRREYSGTLNLRITNPTGFDACVKIFSEHSDRMGTILAPGYAQRLRTVTIPAGQSLVLGA